MIVVGSVVQQASGTIFCRFVLVRNTRHVRKTSKKPRFFLGFCISGACAKSRHACAENIEKIRVGGSKTLPERSQTLQNQPEGAPERDKTNQERQQAAKKHAREAQERPRSAQERKMDPAWPPTEGTSHFDSRTSLAIPCAAHRPPHLKG